jgi:hypothetical protein
MKSIKMFGLAAVATLMAMAFVGVSSAMAEHTALCADHEALCAEPIEHVHEKSAGNMTLLTSSLNVVCENVLFLGDTLVALANPLVIHGAFTYPEFECSNNCIVEEENGPAELKILREGKELAKVTIEWLIHVICFGFINCRYNGVGLLGHGLGPLLSTQLSGEISFIGQKLNKERGTLCPSTAKLDLVTTPLEHVYISS